MDLYDYQQKEIIFAHVIVAFSKHYLKMNEDEESEPTGLQEMLIIVQTKIFIAILC